MSLLKVGLSGVFCCLFCLIGFNLVQAAEGQGQSPAAPEETAASGSTTNDLEKLLKTYFTYQRENRPDPFATFIKKETPKAKIEGQETPEEELSGMQLFEPGQLRLVSIVFSEDSAFAMVEDSVGKGYIIKKGTLIGRRGVVEDILPNVVVIKQWSLSFAGQKKYKNIEMVLRKEGE
jgi:type IV pilus assembly protein PilP